MRILRALLLALLGAGCRCAPSTQPLNVAPLNVAPSELDFGAVYLGASRTLELELRNETRVDQEVALSAGAPFSTPSTLVVSGGSSAVLQVTFVPNVAGVASTTLRVDTTNIALRGVGFPPLDCAPPSPCFAVRFDPTSGECLSAALEEGADCTASEACFAKATCLGGACRGTLTTCDDGDACTLDVCGEAGCGHLDSLLTCPWPSNPCQVPSCERSTGCGTTDAPDGTPCGARDCTSAKVCIAGACVSRPVPTTLGCVEVVAGRPGGRGWADGVGATARFGYIGGLAQDSTGAVWVVDSYYPVVRKVAPSGQVTTIAGVHDAPLEEVDGFGSSARFDFPHDVAIDPQGNVLVADRRTIRKMSPRGLVTTFVGARDAGVATDGVGVAARFESIGRIDLAPDGTLWVLDQQDAGPVLRQVSPNGQVTTAFRPDLDSPITDLVATHSGIAVTTSSGLTIFAWDGGAQGPPSDLARGHLALSPTHELWSERAGSIGRVEQDGGFTPLAALPAWISALAPFGMREWVVATPQNGGRLYVISEQGQTRLLAGPERALPTADGSSSLAGFSSAGYIAQLSDGSILVSDIGSIRRVAGGFVTSIASARPAADLAVLPGDVVAVAGGATQRLFDAGFTVVGVDAHAVDALGADLAYVNSFGLWRGPGPDGGFVQGCAGTFQHLLQDGAGGYFFVEASRIRHIDASCSVTTFLELEADAVVGPLTREAQGNLLFADLAHYQVLRATPAKALSIVAQLADQPRSIVVEDGGSLLVTVGEAILRIK